MKQPLQKRIEMLEARMRKLEAELEELRSLKKENEILRFNIESLLKYIEDKEGMKQQH